MKGLVAFGLAALLSSPALANCVPPWQTQFACNIPERNARAEFCRIAAPVDHPSKKEAYYIYVVGTAPAELYFETDSLWFSTKDMLVDHPTDLTMAVGFARADYVYAFVVTEDKREHDGIRDGEVRVYESTDAFTNDVKGNQVNTLYCDPESIVADLPSIRP
ncbi:hypothetical protein [Shinella kummerowiae]|uniref:hypothetical protein n=1 Tax=Shinella kummerowiae TaxID=417745 RepID=UPI0021B683A8|nr:hypothetical protein [Shinella kummerowiae]MCT7663164.1 hypothetical protein [Shinella kummerowiae]